MPGHTGRRGLARRTAEPGVSVKQLLEEITAMAYTGALNLLYKYINQGRLDGDRITPSPRPVDPMDPDTTNGAVR
jgi:hypothetical protein